MKIDLKFQFDLKKEAIFNGLIELDCIQQFKPNIQSNGIESNRIESAKSGRIHRIRPNALNRTETDWIRLNWTRKLPNLERSQRAKAKLWAFMKNQRNLNLKIAWFKTGLNLTEWICNGSNLIANAWKLFGKKVTFEIDWNLTTNLNTSLTRLKID